MVIRVLIVEDDAYQRDELRDHLAASGLPLQFEEAAALDEARRLIAEVDFDVIFCDMHIPSEERSADHSIEYGRQAYQDAIACQPGTVKVFYSAFIDLDTIGDELQIAATADLFGDGEQRALTRQVLKGRGLDPCLEVLTEIATGLEGLSSISVRGQGSADPDELETRAMRLFAHMHGGTAVVARRLGGLSGSSAFSVQVRDDRDRYVARGFAKVGPHADLDVELRRFRVHVENRLPMGSYASQTLVVGSLVGRRKAVFYDLAEQFDRTLLEMLGVDDRGAAHVVKQLRALEIENWPPHDDTFELKELRRPRISDGDLQPHLGDVGLDAVAPTVDALTFLASIGVQHGDLHGQNVLVDSSSQGLLIDLADVGLAPVGLDPITLELCCITHPNSPLVGGSWPTNDQLEQWFDLDTYLVDCPSPEFVAECRRWLMEVCPDDRVVAAILWAHAARQFKYPVLPQASIGALMRAAAARLV